MFIESIRYALENIKSELQLLANKNKPTYELQPVVNIAKHVVDLIEKHGIPDLDTESISPTGDATSIYFNNLSASIRNIAVITSRILDELTDRTNTTLELYTKKINQIEPLMEDLRQRFDDIEKQTLEKVTNTSIHEHEVKNINFSNNVDINNLTIVNNVALLPIARKKKVVVANAELAIIGSSNATKKLGTEIELATSDRSDADTLTGTYFGNLIGMLDGSEAFESEDSFDINWIYDLSINKILRANLYSTDPNDELEIEVYSRFNAGSKVNFVQIDTNSDAKLLATLNGNRTILEMKNNIWAQKLGTDAATFNLIQDRPDRLRYQGINIIDKNTSTTVAKYNYLSSLAYLYADIFAELLDNVEVSEVETTPNHKIELEERTGMYKYPIEVNNISFYEHEYESFGQWTSELIVTELPVISVEINSDHVIPDDKIEYIKYEISFDKNTWYQLRPTNAGLTEFNQTLKTRIVLNNDNNNLDYIFIGSQANNMGIYLRVTMNSGDSSVTPVLHNLQLKIKVDSNA